MATGISERKDAQASQLTIRLPAEAVEVLEAESRETGIPLAVLIRSAVLRDLRSRLLLGGDARNPDKTTGKQTAEQGAFA